MAVRQDTEIAKSEFVTKDRRYVKSLARGLQVLQAFKAEDRGLSNSELAHRTGLPKPTISRLTFTLYSLGYLDIDDSTGRYLIHPHILSLGYPVLQRFSIRELARPYMRELADTNHASAAMAVRDGLEMIVIERVRHESMMSVPVDIGVSRRLATSSLGRAHLAALRPAERDKLLDELRLSEKKNWPTLSTKIEESLNCYMKHGYCVSDGDWQTDYIAVSAPLVLPDMTIISFNCGGLKDRLTNNDINLIAEKLVQMVTKIGKFSSRGSLFSS